jgi:hypothetical protein
MANQPIELQVQLLSGEMISIALGKDTVEFVLARVVKEQFIYCAAKHTYYPARQIRSILVRGGEA